ncbi:MAG: glycoside hydrolase family 3 N-terminal domain-containing protein [Edaphocola sp.]
MKKIVFAQGIVLVLLFMAGIACNGQGQPGKPGLKRPPLVTTQVARAVRTKSVLSQRLLHPDAALENKVNELYNRLTPRQRAAQMIMTASSPVAGLGYPFGAAQKLVQQDIAANVVFLKGTAAGFKQEAAKLKADVGAEPVGPLFACDCEPTLLPSKWSDAGHIKPAADQQDTATVQQETLKINALVKNTGVQLNFAPVADAAMNKAIINKRSFGATEAQIFPLAEQFIVTSQQGGIGATIKHFPGHGAVKGDSHKQSVYIDGELTELPLFQRLITGAEPPAAVMVGHIIVQNNPKYGTDGLPATLSRKIITDLLRNELHYDGIITTDALNMAAAAKVADADWKSVEAGADLILMPRNAAALNKKIVAAMAANNGLSRQIEASVKRILRYKIITNQ